MFRINTVLALIDVHAGESPALGRKGGYLRVSEVCTDGNAVVAIQIFSQSAKASAIGRRDFDDFRKTVNQPVDRLNSLIQRNFNRPGETIAGN